MQFFLPLSHFAKGQIYFRLSNEDTFCFWGYFHKTSPTHFQVWRNRLPVTHWKPDTPHENSQWMHFGHLIWLNRAQVKCFHFSNAVLFCSTKFIALPWISICRDMFQQRTATRSYIMFQIFINIMELNNAFAFCSLKSEPSLY